MKTRLYLSLDQNEAEVLVENLGRYDNPKYAYEEIGMHEGQKLEKKLGFNPMCSVDFDESERTIQQIVSRLTKHGIFVSVGSEGNFVSHFPPDMNIRNRLLECSLREKDDEMYGSQSAFSMLQYSNNPYQISERVPFKFIDSSRRDFPEPRIR